MRAKKHFPNEMGKICAGVPLILGDARKFSKKNRSKSPFRGLGDFFSKIFVQKVGMGQDNIKIHQTEEKPLLTKNYAWTRRTSEGVTRDSRFTFFSLRWISYLQTAKYLAIFGFGYDFFTSLGSISE